MAAPVKFINDGRYYGIPKDTTIVWKPKLYAIDHFNFDKFKVRVEKYKDEGNKKALETMKRNAERVCKDNPNMFDDFLALLSQENIMPIKFKSSVKNPKTRSVQNYYMRSTPQAELVETLNATNTTPKRKQQIRNELVKRGV